MDWRKGLKADPIPALLRSDSLALRFHVRRELEGACGGRVRRIWDVQPVRRLTGAQRPNGSWRYSGGKEHLRAPEDYDQIETFRVLRDLVEKFCLDRSQGVIRRAAEFLFSRQTDEGDFRGICGRQYVPYYWAAMMELLIKAGYAEDKRIARGFRWLLSMRQDDGGRAFPMRTAGMTLSPEAFKAPAVEPNRSKPFSHLVTGVVLRAFAAHPRYRSVAEAERAGRLLASRFFRPDKYPDRRAPMFWTSFSFPFWFTDLLSSLDSLSAMGFDSETPGIREGLDWFLRKQGPDGLWRLPLRIMAGEHEPDAWISLAVCRVVKRFSGRL